MNNDYKKLDTIIDALIDYKYDSEHVTKGAKNPKDENRVNINFTIGEHAKEELKFIARTMGLDLSKLMRKIINEYLSYANDYESKHKELVF